MKYKNLRKLILSAKELTREDQIKRSLKRCRPHLKKCAEIITEEYGGVKKDEPHVFLELTKVIMNLLKTPYFK